MGGMLDYVSGEYVGGPSEIVGAIEEIIGAANIPNAAKQALINQVAKVRQAGGVMTVPKAVGMKYKLAPFETQAIAASATATFKLSVQEQFRPQRLIVSSPTAVVVNSIKVATAEQFITSGSVPGEAFASDAWGAEFEFNTANIGNTIEVSVTNVSAEEIDFYAAFLGVSIG